MGRWEDAVIRVTIAGDPNTVDRMSTGWKTVSETAPEFGAKLATMLKALTTGPHAWRGKAAQEFESVVKQINREIQNLADDTGTMASNLNDASHVLSDAISNIPVPLLKSGGHWYGGSVSHSLPGGTDMDDGRKMHARVGGFVDTLRADYEGNRDAYTDFRKAVEALYAPDHQPTRNNFTYDPNDPQVPGGDLRSGTQNGAAYRGDFSKINEWYDANAKIADEHFSSLKDSYVQHRGQYHFDRGIHSLDLATQPGDHQTPPGGRTTGYGATGAGGAGAGADPASFDPSSVLTNWSGAAHEPSWPGTGADPGGTGSAAPGGPDVGSKLAGSVPSGAGAWPGGGAAGLGGGVGAGGPSAGGLGGGGFGGGGSASGVGASGYEGPMPPVTTPPTPALDAAAGGRPGATGRSGMGMMPNAGTGGRRGERDERTTWLTEDEDVFGPQHTAPKTNSAGAIE